MPLRETQWFHGQCIVGSTRSLSTDHSDNLPLWEEKPVVNGVRFSAQERLLLADSSQLAAANVTSSPAGSSPGLGF
jgi:hypothetical protein